MRSIIKKISLESSIILLIGTIDLISTIVLLTRYEAKEANPLMEIVLEYGGIPLFAAAKLLSIVGGVIVLEYGMRKTPAFTRRAARVAIAVYLLSYVIGVVGINA
jgi:hypothetical protein